MGHALSPLFSWRSSICDSDLPPTARHVALTLSLHMNERGESCFPAASTLVQETGLSERTVREAIRLLGEVGWLLKEARHLHDGRQTSNLYTAAIPSPGGVQQMQGGGAADAPPGVQQMQGGGAADAPLEDVNRGRQGEDAKETDLCVAVDDDAAGVLAPIRLDGHEANDRRIRALASECGLTWSKMGEDEVRACSLAATKLGKIGVTPEEIAGVSFLWRRTYKRATMTPSAIARHWAQIHKAGPLTTAAQTPEVASVLDVFSNRRKSS